MLETPSVATTRVTSDLRGNKPCFHSCFLVRRCFKADRVNGSRLIGGELEATSAGALRPRTPPGQDVHAGVKSARLLCSVARLGTHI